MDGYNETHDDYRVEWAASKEGPSLRSWLRQRQVDGWRHDGGEPRAYFDSEGPLMRYRFIRE
ncbi:MAG: hypothetical protein ACRDOY_03225 [Nocardioidaceae bacterium]